jgi:hypothetical protein
LNTKRRILFRGSFV